MEDFQRSILAAQGYHELGLWREAWRELDGLSDAAQHRPDVLEMRVLILINERKWREALALSRQLAEVAPEEEGGWVHSAYCLHELGRTREAIQALLSGESHLPLQFRLLLLRPRPDRRRPRGAHEEFRARPAIPRFCPRGP